MRRAGLAAVVASLALAAAGCDRTEPNPFLGLIETRAPSTSAAILLTSSLHSTESLRREVYAIERSGANPSRLSFCNSTEAQCDTVEVAPGPDRNRVMLRRALADSNGDRVVDARDAAGIVFADLSRGVEAELVAASVDVTGLDWSQRGGTVIYSARNAGQGQEDLFIMDPNGQNGRPLTGSSGLTERRPRIEESERYAVFERIPAGGRGHVALIAGPSLLLLTPEGVAGPALAAGSTYTIGSDADPAPGPAGMRVAFRRLVAAGNGTLGSWDIMTVGVNGADLLVVASGPAWRGAPDWGPDGIVFEEIDTVAGRRAIVVVQPDGTRREVLLPLPLAPNAPEAWPRWLR